MISTRLSPIVLLLVFVNGAWNEDAVQPCAKVQTSSSVVALGSPVSATCVIREDCPLALGPTVRIDWRLDNRVLPNSSVVNESSRISQVVIPNFNSTRAFLTCCILTSPMQIVGGVEIRAGYPPSMPQTPRCQTNLTAPPTLTCCWDPGQDSHLPTKYSLHTNIRDMKNHSYEVPPGLYHYVIPRSDFSILTEMEIYVKAVNELGETASAPVSLEPLSAAKFDPPEILNVAPTRNGCLRIYWRLCPQLNWVGNNLKLAVQLRTADSGNQWGEQPNAERHSKNSKPIDLCRLLHGTRYFIQIRVRYLQGSWSEWSSSRSGVTLEKAPTGRLDTWMKVSGDHTHKHVNVHLFWKPSKQFRANSQNVSYVVTKQPVGKGKLCATARNYCTFQAPARARVYLRAVNAAGKSLPIELYIYPTKAYTAITSIKITPHNDTSLLVKWTSLETASLRGYVVEWRPLLQTDPSNIQFQSTSKNQSSLIIAGSIEPYKPYGISVYPRFKDGIGLPQTTDAFSRQMAPSMVPTLRIKKTWQSSIELTWDEIPLDQRNGIIQNYKVFYWDEKGTVKVGDGDLDKRRVLLKDLNPLSLYEAFLMASTLGGSWNGSAIHFKTEPFDMVAVVIIVMSGVFALVLTCIIIPAACASKHKRCANRFCPVVPDPANSSIKEWTTEALQVMLPAFKCEEPNLVYLSNLSFLDLPTKIPKEEDDSWLNSAEDTSDLGESICGSPFIPGYCGTNSDSVPYATLIFSSACTSPAPKEDHIYLRSESTQPLLETEEAFTPKCYQNIATDTTNGEQCFFGPCDSDELETRPEPDFVWDEFPFLRALALNDTQDNSDFLCGKEPVNPTL